MAEFRFSEALYSSLDLIPPSEDRPGERIDFIRAVRERPSTMFRSAIESIDGGISLLALGRLSQAFIL